MGIKPWSKTYIALPRDNLISHVRSKYPKFVASYEYDENPPPMSLLIGMEYSRIWHKERDSFGKCQRKIQKRKMIPNNFHDWIKKRTPKQKTEKCNMSLVVKKKARKHGKGEDYDCGCKEDKAAPAEKKMVVPPKQNVVCSNECKKPVVVEETQCLKSKLLESSAVHNIEMLKNLKKSDCSTPLRQNTCQCAAKAKSSCDTRGAGVATKAACSVCVSPSKSTCGGAAKTASSVCVAPSKSSCGACASQTKTTTTTCGSTAKNSCVSPSNIDESCFSRPCSTPATRKPQQQGCLQ